MLLINLVGNRYGKLLVLHQSKKRGPKGQIFWTCKCDCGGTTDIVGFALRRNTRVSCGKCVRDGKNKNPDRVNAIYNNLYRFLKNRDKNYGGLCDLSFEEYVTLSSKPCFYCGLESSNKTCDTKHNRLKHSDAVVLHNGLDRVDSSFGYTRENVVTCCKECNRAKNTMSHNEYRDFIKRVYKSLWK